MNQSAEPFALRLAAACPGLAFTVEDTDDLPLLRRLYTSVREEELRAVAWSDAQKQTFIDGQFDLQRQHYRAHYPDAEFLVVREAGEPIGRIYLHIHSSEIRLMDIVLLPSVRGRGLGSRMLTALIAEARREQRSITLHVESNNPARQWYERQGFVLIEDRGIYLFLGWQPPRSTLAGANAEGASIS